MTWPDGNLIYRGGGIVRLVERHPLLPTTHIRSEPRRLPRDTPAAPKKKPVKDWLATDKEKPWLLP